MQDMAKRSGFLSVTSRELIKGFFTALASSVIGSLLIISNAMAAGQHVDITSTMKMGLFGGLAGGLGYIGKKIFTNSDDKFLKKEPEKNDTDNP